MKNLTDHLSQYAAYHRDSRNIATHFVGIPLIVLAVVILLSRPAYMLSFMPWMPASPAVWVAVVLVVFYLYLDRPLGIALALFLEACLWIAAPLAALPTANWLAWGIGLFVVGWVIQFVGHYFESRKPAFFDDIMGLAIGPLFVAAELGFAMGLRKPLEAAIAQRSGPMVRRKGWLPAAKMQ